MDKLRTRITVSWDDVSLDADAQTFITVANITDQTQINAINQLVLDLKSYSLWELMIAIYPIVGGNATSHKYNLKDYTQYEISWSGGLTHSSTGVLPNGINGFGNTNLIPVSAGVGTYNAHVSYYSRSNTAAGNFCEIGGTDTGNARGNLNLNIRYTGDLCYPVFGGDAYPTGAVTDSRGYFIASKYETDKIWAFRNTSVLVNNQTQYDDFNDDANIYLMAWNNQGVTQRYTDRECAFATIGLGLTQTQANNLYTCVNTYQTTLGRNV